MVDVAISDRLGLGVEFDACPSIVSDDIVIALGSDFIVTFWLLGISASGFHHIEELKAAFERDIRNLAALFEEQRHRKSHIQYGLAVYGSDHFIVLDGRATRGDGGIFNAASG